MTIKEDAHFVDCGLGKGVSGTETWTTGTKICDYPISVILGYYPASVAAALSQYKSDRTLDTTWATSGNWLPTPPPTWDNWAFHGLAKCNDGGLIVGYSPNTITKLDEDGVVDTSWGTNGFVTTTAAYPISATVDSKDNAYIGFYNADVESLIKLDSDGVQQWSFGAGYYVYGSALLTYNGTPLLICAIMYKIQYVPVTAWYNVVAINRNTGEVETSWGTNGYANPSAFVNAITSYSIRIDENDKIYVHHDMLSVGSDYYSITRLNSDGSVDTSWGTSGRAGLNQQPVVNSKYSWNNTIDLIGDNLYTISHPQTTGTGYDRTIVYVNVYDIDGTETNLKTITGLGNEPVKCIVGGGGYLFLGGNYVDLEGDGASSLHYYSYAGAYLGKFVNTTSVTHLIKIPDIDSPDVIIISTDVQSRTIAYPSGYSHLEGETCQVLADGAVHPDVTISGGTYALNYSADNVHMGLGYESKILPMKLDGEVYYKRIYRIILNFFETLGGLFGETEDSLEVIVFRTAGDEMNSSADLFTGQKELDFEGSYNRQGNIWIKQNQPLPFNLIGIGIKLEVYDS